MTAPTDHPLALYQGDDHTITLEFQQEDETAEDVSTYAYRAQIRRTATHPEALAEADIDMSSAADGLVVVKFLAADTGGLPTAGVWDLEETNPDGDVATILRGAVTVEREVTR